VDRAGYQLLAGAALADDEQRPRNASHLLDLAEESPDLGRLAHDARLSLHPVVEPFVLLVELAVPGQDLEQPRVPGDERAHPVGEPLVDQQQIRGPGRHGALLEIRVARGGGEHERKVSQLLAKPRQELDGGRASLAHVRVDHHEGSLSLVARAREQRREGRHPLDAGVPTEGGRERLFEGLRLGAAGREEQNHVVEHPMSIGRSGGYH
jgi:hypothetical protein